MKAKIKKVIEVDVVYLQVDAGVRYYEDATVDGVEDVNGDLIPCKSGERWYPLIEIETGRVVNWKQGVTADIHYKVCDDGTYTLLDADKNEIDEDEGYVPSVMCPKGNGYGDYIIMDIDADGFIQGWEKDKVLDFDCFDIEQ